MFASYEDSVMHAANTITGQLSPADANSLLKEHGFTMSDIIEEFGHPIYCAASLLEALGY